MVFGGTVLNTLELLEDTVLSTLEILGILCVFFVVWVFTVVFLAFTI